MLKMCNMYSPLWGTLCHWMNLREGQSREREKKAGREEKMPSGCRGTGFQPSPASKCPTSERL